MSHIRRSPHRRPSPAAFTLTELLVVIAVLALLVAVRLPALCRTNAPVKLVQCLSNCRQIGLATMLYRTDNQDTYPFGDRVYGSGTVENSVLDPTGWPMQLLPYLGGYKTYRSGGYTYSVQPKVYLCPGEKEIASNWAFQLHYQANRMLVSDFYDRDTPVRAAAVRNPALYWLFMEKGPSDFANTKPGALANPYLISWNTPPGSPAYRRHSGGLAAAAADGHVEWLRMPLYQPGQPPPQNFMELGDSANGQNNPSTWTDNGPCPVKLYCRYNQQGF
jgi:prepilin-type N-terminal cleavage/methylation domain-containing protein/prepilin-type processing-associated H-X9-DG protein